MLEILKFLFSEGWIAGVSFLTIYVISRAIVRVFAIIVIGLNSSDSQDKNRSIKKVMESDLNKIK